MSFLHFSSSSLLQPGTVFAVTLDTTSGAVTISEADTGRSLGTAFDNVYQHIGEANGLPNSDSLPEATTTLYVSYVYFSIF